MTPRAVVCEDIEPTAWKNGGGVTRVLAIDAKTPWRWRISAADIAADGPFSHYPGVERWFSVVVGKGVELAIGDRIHRLDCTSEPFKFSGEASAFCRLRQGKTRDLNLMLRGIRGAMARAVPDVPHRPAFSASGLFVTTPGRCTSDEVESIMSSFSLVWFEETPGTLCWHPTSGCGHARSAPAAYWIDVDVRAGT